VGEPIENFINELSQSLSAGTFVKLSLGNYKGSEEHLQKIKAREIETKKGRVLHFEYRYKTRDVAKNLGYAEALAQTRDLLTSGFRSAHLFTTLADHELTVGKKNSRLVKHSPTMSEKPATAHDRPKRKLIDQHAGYLKELGVTTSTGEIRAQQQDKWRQINKYVEILTALLDKSSLKDKSDLRIVDMGSGKGYLTFAAYDHLTNARGLNIEMTGVDERQDMVDLCNRVARASGFEGLNFVRGTIADFDPGHVDVLIALHACDTATDDALYKGIVSNAELIVAAPGCHKEIRRQIEPPEVLKEILKHGTMLEREAETITDGLRAMLLERSGYSTRVFEFVPTEHTPKNNMIAATRNHKKDPGNQSIQEQIEGVKSLYGIREQRLENLLT